MAIQLGRRTTSNTAPVSSSDWLQQARCAAEHSDDTEVVVDISTVEMIRSRELNELIRLHLSVKQEGRHLVLENAQDHLLHVFTETRLDRLISIRCHHPA